MARLARTAGSLVVVLAAYWVYALAAVPWIEPARERQRRAPASPAERSDARDAANKQRRNLSSWFSQGDWELTSPKILETPQGKLLLKTYRNLDGGRVKIEPCTMVFLPEGRFASQEDRNRRAIILRAREGAILQFDAPFDLKRGKIGKLVGGQLVGPITIHSDLRSAGPDDDLRINARDLAVSENRIETSHPIDFRLGPHQGQGRRLVIHLSLDQPEAADGDGTGFGGVTSVELVHDVRMRIEPRSADIFPGGAQRGLRAENAPAPDKPMPPVEVTCQGPFRFDLGRHVASFEDRVDVQRHNPGGPSDQLTCDLLELHFEAHAAAAQAPPEARRRALPRLEPSRLSARGNPVVVRSPSNGLVARGHWLQYDIQGGGGSLQGKGTEEVMLRQEGHDGADARGSFQREIHARQLEFQPDPAGRLGTFRASGAGWLEATVPNDPAQKIEARWTKLLCFRPYEQNQVLSVQGASHVELAGRGEIDAEEIHLWLLESPAGASAAAGPPERRPNLLPDRLSAKGNVRLNSPLLAGKVGHLQVWFKHAPPPAATAGPGEGGPQAASPHAPARPRIDPEAGAPGPPRSTVPEAAGRRRRFRIEAELLQVEVTLGGQQAEISEAFVDRRVYCAESETGQPGHQPLVLEGDRLHLVQRSPDQGTVTLTGQPARASARGMSLVGGAIDLDRGQNKLWIDGAGRMSLPLPGDGPPGQAPAPRWLEVTWQGRMDFDGRTALVSRKVVARHGAQRMETEWLRVTLTRPVRFSAGAADDAPEVEQVACRGGVFAESQTHEGGRLIALDRMWARDLDLRQRTGELEAQGPGWVTSVRAGTGESLLSTPAAPAVRSSNPEARTENPADLVYLGVEFQRALEGNLRRREIIFQEQVRSVYGTVGDWEARLDPDEPEKLGQKGFVLTSDRLVVAETGRGRGGEALYELVASGNTLVEGSAFTARASRLTYTQAKDLLVLEGDGRTDARLFRQGRLGGPTSEAAARKILYWRSTNRVEVDDAQFLDLSELTGARRR